MNGRYQNGEQRSEGPICWGLRSKVASQPVRLLSTSLRTLVHRPKDPETGRDVNAVPIRRCGNIRVDLRRSASGEKVWLAAIQSGLLQLLLSVPVRRTLRPGRPPEAASRYPALAKFCVAHGGVIIAELCAAGRANLETRAAVIVYRPLTEISEAAYWAGKVYAHLSFDRGFCLRPLLRRRWTYNVDVV